MNKQAMDGPAAADIQNPKDIEWLIDKFYHKVLSDPSIGRFFAGLMDRFWEQHVPIMNAFWCSILLGDHTPPYTGNPMKVHQELNSRMPLEKKHFDRWLFLWEETIDENFSGKIAGEAKSRARNIAAIMQRKLSLGN